MKNLVEWLNKGLFQWRMTWKIFNKVDIMSVYLLLKTSSHTKMQLQENKKILGGMRQLLGNHTGTQNMFLIP